MWPTSWSALLVWRATLRLTGAVVHVAHGVAIAVFRFPSLSPAARAQRVQWWCATLLRRLGVSLHVDGQFRPGAKLIVANHVSWLDILAINAISPVRFVSKAEVKHWPLLGRMVTAGGTLYIERERSRDALRVIHQMAQALQSGDTVAVFPEGTTSDGHTLLPFHANLFQAAISTQTPVQALALRYADDTAPISTAAAYVGKTTLLQSVWWIVCASGLHARVVVLPAQADRHADRRQLARRTETVIRDALRPDPNS